MVSLTPQQHSEQITAKAFKEGFINGSIAIVPSYGAVWLAMKQSPKFMRSTNWQSRTALVLMPALFTFAYTAERTLEHRMKEMANHNDHIRSSAAWAERKHAEDVRKIQQTTPKFQVENINTEEQLMDLYRQSVSNSGVRVVPGNKLSAHHKFANFWQDHPFKILAAASLPAVGYIFYGRSGQDHLQLQSKIMHTRVYGQFAVITMLLSLMGFKEYMDRNGRFITEAESETRVMEMRAVREGLVQRLQYEKSQKKIEDDKILQAHEEDVRTGNVHEKKPKKKHAAKQIDTVSI